MKFTNVEKQQYDIWGPGRTFHFRASGYSIPRQNFLQVVPNTKSFSFTKRQGSTVHYFSRHIHSSWPCIIHRLGSKIYQDVKFTDFFINPFCTKPKPNMTRDHQKVIICKVEESTASRNLIDKKESLFLQYSNFSSSIACKTKLNL